MRLLVAVAALLTLTSALAIDSTVDTTDATAAKTPSYGNGTKGHKKASTHKGSKGKTSHSGSSKEGSGGSGSSGEKFYLVAESNHKPINGMAFESCHSGAAREALCVGKTGPNKAPKDSSLFELTGPGSNKNEGYLTWELQAGKSSDAEEMTLVIDVGSNVGLPLFQPEQSNQMVGFDEHDELYMTTYQNDMVAPPKGGKSRKLYRWFTCETLYGGYTYTTLAWDYGRAPPENPSCRQVKVKRVWEKKA